MANLIYVDGTVQTIMSTELNSLANNALALGAAITVTSAGYIRAKVEWVNASIGSAFTDKTAFDLWFIRHVDGTNYEDGSGSVTPARAPDTWFTVRGVTAAQRIVRVVELPPGTWKPLIRNNATGQSLASSGNTVKLLPYTLNG